MQQNRGPNSHKPESGGRNRIGNYLVHFTQIACGHEWPALLVCPVRALRSGAFIFPITWRTEGCVNFDLPVTIAHGEGGCQVPLMRVMRAKSSVSRFRI